MSEILANWSTREIFYISRMIKYRIFRGHLISRIGGPFAKFAKISDIEVIEIISLEEKLPDVTILFNCPTYNCTVCFSFIDNLYFFVTARERRIDTVVGVETTGFKIVQPSVVWLD